MSESSSICKSNISGSIEEQEEWISLVLLCLKGMNTCVVDPLLAGLGSSLNDIYGLVIIKGGF